MEAVLPQKEEDVLDQPVQYASKTLTMAGRNYSTCEKKVPAVVFGSRKIRVYFLSTHPFVLYIDQKALKAASAKRDVHGRLARWLDFLDYYGF